MRDGVEHKSSDLPRGEERLVLWKLFSPTHVSWHVLGGGRLLSLLVGSLALCPFCAQPRRIRAATEPDLLG